jgi:diguanylate cyclase (GGDEF)-like protein
VLGAAWNRGMEFAEGLSRGSLIVASFGLVLAFGILDYLTGKEVMMSVFYLLPISLASWVGDRKTGIMISLFSTLTWIVNDVILEGHFYSSPAIAYWNVAAGLGFFLTVAVVLSALRTAFDQLKHLARTDPLTGIANTRTFVEGAELELSRARRYGGSFSLAYMDLDNFKTVNDEQGHMVGDCLLRAVAATVVDEIRSTDLVARIGGDEFAILLPQSTPESALNVVSRIQRKLVAVMSRSQWPVTFSIGLMTFNAPPDSPNEMIRIVDSLMYQAKTSGKDRLVQDVFPAPARPDHSVATIRVLSRGGS